LYANAKPPERERSTSEDSGRVQLDRKPRRHVRKRTAVPAARVQLAQPLSRGCARPAERQFDPSGTRTASAAAGLLVKLQPDGQRDAVLRLDEYAQEAIQV